MKVVAEESWSWMLFSQDPAMYLAVVCGSVGIYTINIHLTQAEVEKLSSLGNSFLVELASDVREHPTKYTQRNIQGFDDIAGVHEAALAWRKLKDASGP